MLHEGIKGTVFFIGNKQVSLPSELAPALHNDFFIFYKSSVQYWLHFPNQRNAYKFSLSPFNVNLDEPRTVEVLKPHAHTYTSSIETRQRLI